MTFDNIVRSVIGRLSLREPQSESLRKLANALDAVPALRDHLARSPQELAAMVEALHGQFPKLLDFERDFPSLCFALATGVGKTRLMGAFISYLHAAYGYGGFTKCAYTNQKFHSDTERVMAQILERDALRWFRPVQGQFNIYFRRGADQPEYVPDFVAATADTNLLIEAKKAADIDTDEVQAKAGATIQWCAHTSAYSAQHGGKPWRYLLIPHDAVQVNATLSAMATRFSRN